MANQQLVDYIKSQLASGVTKTDLQKAISTAGWSSQDSDEAFMVVEGKVPAAPVTPAAPTPVVTPVQPVQPIPPVQPIRPVTPAAQPMQPIQPMPQSTPMVANPNLGGPMRASTMQMNVQATAPRRHTLLWITLMVIVLLIAGSAAAYYFLPPVQEVVNFYLHGGQTPPVDLGLPPAPSPTTPVPTNDTQASTTAPTPVATSTASTTTHASTSAVASSSASTTLHH